MKFQINKDFFISDNSAQCDANTFFLETNVNKAHKDDAIKRGCKDVLRPQDLKKFLRSDTKVIGITGTNGKSTTAALMYSMLLDLGYKVAMQGTRGFFINDRQVGEKSLTTEQVLTNLTRIHTACEEGCDFFVMEVSSHAISQDRIAGIDFALKILTNITSDHLDFHKTLQNYIDTKLSFFAPQDLALINADEKNKPPVTGKYRTYSIESPATYRLEAYSSGASLMGVISFGSKLKAPFSSDLIGVFNLYNILAASAGVHILTGADLERIAKTVANFAGVKGRMEVVSRKPMIFVDFAHTQDGVMQVLRALYPARVVTVLGAGGDRDKTKRPKMSAAALHYSVRVYLTSDNPRSEDPLEIINDMLSGVEKRDKIIVEPNRKEAIYAAVQDLQEGEILAILGKGDECYQEIKGQKFPFDDRQVVLEALEALKKARAQGAKC